MEQMEPRLGKRFLAIFLVVFMMFSMLPSFAAAEGETSVDKTVLAEKIAAAEGLQEEDYTEDSWAILASALGTARSVYDDADADQETVDAAANDLENAIAGLVSNDAPAETSFTVAPFAGENGNILINGSAESVTVEANTSVSISVQAETGYKISSLTIAGEAITLEKNQASYYVEAYVPTSDIAVAAEFAQIQYTIQLADAENGTVLLNGSSDAVTVDYGEEITVTATPVQDYHIASVTVEYDNGTEDDLTLSEEYTATFTPTDDGTVAAVFAIDQYELTVKVEGDGSVGCEDVLLRPNDTKTFTLDVGTKLTFTVDAAPGNKLAKIVYNENEEPLDDVNNDGEYETKEISEDSELVFVFERNHAVTVEPGTELSGNGYYSVKFVWADEGKTGEVPVQKDYDGDSLTRVILPVGASAVFTPAEGYYTRVRNADLPADDLNAQWTSLLAISSDVSALRLDVSTVPYAVNAQTVNVPFAIVFDGSEPTVSVSEFNETENLVYSSDVLMSVSIGKGKADLESVTFAVYSADEPDAILVNGTILIEDLTYDEESQQYIGTFEVPADKANGSDIVVAVTVKTTVGAEKTDDTCHIAINTTAPEIFADFNEVTVDFKDETTDEDDEIIHTDIELGEEAYYSKNTFEIVINVWDKDYSLNETGVSMSVVSTDANGEDLEFQLPELVLEPVLVKGQPETDENGRTHYVVRIPVEEEGNYTIKDIQYCSLTKAPVEDAAEPGEYKYTLDHTPPHHGAISTKEKTWEILASAISIGLFSSDEVTIVFSGEDEICGEVALYYYIDSSSANEDRENKALLDAGALDKLNEWKDIKEGEELRIEDEQQAFVYLKVVDKAGNYNYFYSEGIVIDKTDPAAPVISISTPTAEPQNGIYAENVVLGITVEDPISNGAYSGLKFVSATIESNDPKPGAKETIVLFDLEQENPCFEGFMQTEGDLGRCRVLAGSLTISKNSNDITVTVNAEDKVGKTSSSDITISIDQTDPEIFIRPEALSGYQKELQSFEIVVTERNFDESLKPSDVVKVSVKDGGVNPSFSEWTVSKDTEGNGDATTHTATVTFSHDGVYSFTADVEDLAGRKAATQSVGEFTIDLTPPTISVSYDNNKVANEKYFDAARTATVSIVEHNFDPSRVTFTPAQNVIWNNAGDTHTARISYTEDGDYTFGVSATDMAENANKTVDYGGSVAATEFTVDTTFEDMVTISDVKDGAAYVYEDEVIPSITVEDTNFDTYEVTLVGIQRGKTIDLTDEVNKLIKEDENGISALFDVFRKTADYDGIYTLYVKGVDLAGNVDEERVRFTVNRFGSVFEYSDDLLDLIDDGGTYNQSIDEDLTFTVYNASPIDPSNVSVVITRDGRPVEANFTVVETTADGESWYSYLVTIDKSNYAEDGVYTVSVATTDDAENTVENTGDNSDGDILFYVDSTAPQLTSVSGLEERIVNTTELEVSYTVYDTIGLASVQVKVDGEIVDSATDFDNASNYSGKFTIYEKSSEQHVSFILTDKAGNVTESDAEGFEVPYTLEKNVTVSTNLFVRWFANKPLFYGGIGGGVAVLGGLGALLGLKKKKKAKVS